MKLHVRYVLILIDLILISAILIITLKWGLPSVTVVNWKTATEPWLDENKCPAFETREKTQLNSSKNDSISLIVRMSGKLQKHRKRFYCDLFSTSVLYWPASYGKTVVVLDEESKKDHEFAANLTKLNKQFPGRRLEVAFETLPKHPSVLHLGGSHITPGYNRQLWSSFFMDLYANDSIIAWLDTDNAFATPVTKASIFKGSRVRVLGSDCTMNKFRWVQKWASTTEIALGLPMVADFMTYFPVYIYRDTFTNCRKHILKRFNTFHFEKAFKKFYYRYEISPVNIVLSYAWYFERERYEWNIKICSNLNQYNKRFPSGHSIGPEHVVNILSEPQTVFHTNYAEEAVVTSTILASYCLSHEAAGNKPAKCSNHSATLSNNFVLFNQDLQRVNFTGPPCAGDQFKTCLQVLRRHYKQVGLEIKRNERKLDWRNMETVEKLASEVGIDCK